MLCRNWNKETFYCKIKARVISPEESSICEDCPSFQADRSQRVFCNNCGKSFVLTKDHMVQIKDSIFPKCPACGEVVGIRTDDDRLR